MCKKQKTFFLIIFMFYSFTFCKPAFCEKVLAIKMLDTSIESLFSQLKVNDNTSLEFKNIGCDKEFLQKLQKVKRVEYLNENYDHHSKLRSFRLKGVTSCTIDFKHHTDTKNTFMEYFSEKEPKRYGFYTGISGGKIFFDNSQVFVGGIKAIVRRVGSLIKESSYADFIKTILIGEIDSIEQFKGKVNFQWVSNAFVGYYTRENGRTEFEVIYSTVKIAESSDKVFDESASIFTFLLNAYYNPTIQNTRFAPYISLGIGPTVLRVRKFAKENLVPLNVPWFAYQAKFGVDYLITSDITISAGYRYFSIPIPIADNITTHNIEIGLRFNL